MKHFVKDIYFMLFPARDTEGIGHPPMASAAEMRPSSERPIVPRDFVLAYLSSLIGFREPNHRVRTN